MPFRHREPGTLPSWGTVLTWLSFAEKGYQMPAYGGATLGRWRSIDLSDQMDGKNIIVLAFAENFPRGGFQPKFKPDRTEHHALLRCVVRPGKSEAKNNE
jgi:hypothetical protein